MCDEVIFSLKPKYADLIVKGLKNHEFRNCTPKIPPRKIWFYITGPVSSLLYIADVSPAVTYPSKINSVGEGNEEFNNGFKKGEYAFPIVHLHKLKSPIDLSRLRKDFKFTAPQGFVYANKYPELYKCVTKAKTIKIY